MIVRVLERIVSDLYFTILYLILRYRSPVFSLCKKIILSDNVLLKQGADCLTKTYSSRSESAEHLSFDLIRLSKQKFSDNHRQNLLGDCIIIEFNLLCF